MANNDLRKLIFIVAMLAVSVIVRQLVLGGHPIVKLDSAQALTGSISQALSGDRPDIAQGFQLKDTSYFDNKSWVVVSVVPDDNSLNTSLVILQNKSGIYQVAAGPGSSFPESILVSLPADVGQFLQSQGVIYAPGQ